VENRANAKGIETLDYSSKDAQLLLSEFSKLLHEMTKEHEESLQRLKTEYERELAELRAKLQGHEGSYSPVAELQKQSNASQLDRQLLKRLLRRIAKRLFHYGKRLTERLGIIKLIKKSAWAHRLIRAVKERTRSWQ